MSVCICLGAQSRILKRHTAQGLFGYLILICSKLWSSNCVSYNFFQPSYNSLYLETLNLPDLTLGFGYDY